MSMLERLLAASISVAERDKVAKALKDAHARVVQTGADRLAKMHGAESLVTEDEHVRALEAFHTAVVSALNLARL